MGGKLFIPGPSEVREEVLAELSNRQIGHRTDEFRELFSGLKPGLQDLFCTKNDVLVSTSSGSGFWEASIRSCIKSDVLHAVNGAFSKKWADVSKRCGKNVTKIEFDDGDSVDPSAIDKALSESEYEAFCMVHNETSTGTASDLEAISAVMKKHANVLWFVDAVSSIGGMKIETDKLGIDIVLASGQKAMALPPGMAFAAVSKRAYVKAESVEGRGYYFDLLELKKNYDKDMTPYTPSIPHLYATQKQLQRMESEGLENRYKRHKEMASFVRNWGIGHGFKMFSKDNHHSDTISCMVNTLDVDFKKIKKDLAEKYSVDSGYRKMNEKLTEVGKPTTFRIAHMGDLTLDEVKDYLSQIEKYIPVRVNENTDS